MPRRRRKTAKRPRQRSQETLVAVDVELNDTEETVRAKIKDRACGGLTQQRGLTARQFAALPRQHPSLQSRQLGADIDAFYEKRCLCLSRGDGRCGVYAMIGSLLHGFATQTQIATALVAAAEKVGMVLPERTGTLQKTLQRNPQWVERFVSCLLARVCQEWERDIPIECLLDDTAIDPSILVEVAALLGYEQLKIFRFNQDEFVYENCEPATEDQPWRVHMLEPTRRTNCSTADSVAVEIATLNGCHYSGVILRN